MEKENNDKYYCKCCNIYTIKKNKYSHNMTDFHALNYRDRFINIKLKRKPISKEQFLIDKREEKEIIY
jgi:hypothetical protein